MSPPVLKITALRIRPPSLGVSAVLSQLSSRPLHTSVHLQRENERQKLTPPSSRRRESLDPIKKAEAAAQKARENLKIRQRQLQSDVQMGGLARNSPFAPEPQSEAELSSKAAMDQDDLSNRNLSNLARVLNPRPNARARWQRAQVIRHVRRSGRLTKEMQIARTERSHLAKSHFFKTSMKKLAPLARQIAGKSIDEAILQMRFSKKQVAHDVREHLIQARNEAIAMKGMGIRPNSSLQDSLPSGPLILDPSITPIRPDQNPTKSRRDGTAADQTDIYVAQAWTNQGPYGRVPEYRARGRMNILRPPHTGISVILKEEKTRSREKDEKEIRAIKKRLGKSSWTQLPDRPVTNQSQYLLW